MSTTLPDDTMIVTLRVADLREVVRAAVVEALAAEGRHDLLDLKQVAERYRIGRDSVLAAAKRGEIVLSQGPRRKFLVRGGEVERWLTERKYVPRDRAVPADLEDWDRRAEATLQKAIADGRLRKLSPQEIEDARQRRKVEAEQRKRLKDAARR